MGKEYTVLSQETFENQFRRWLASKGLPQAEIDRIATVCFGKPGEVGAALGQQTIEEIALVLWQKWQDTEWYRPSDKEEILRLHKATLPGGVRSEVMVTPTGRVAIYVMHLAGFDDRYMPLVNHAIISWDPDRKRWVLATFWHLNKMAAIARVLEQNPQASFEQVLFALSNVAPFKEKEFGSLKAALKEAVQFATRLVDAWIEDGRITVTKEAHKQFNAIEPLKSLAADEDECLQEALRVAADVPNLFTLDSMLIPLQA